MNPIVQAEEAVLGSILNTQGRLLDDIRLDPDDFYEPRRGDLYRLMLKEHENGRMVDAFTITQNPGVDASEVWALTSTVASASMGPYYADIVAKNALLRRLSYAATELAKPDPEMDTAAIADRARQYVETAIGAGAQRTRYVRDVLPDVIEAMEAKATFLPSPWPSLNAAIGGFRPGAVYIVAARPGVGKTVIAGQIAVALAQHGHVAFSSLEMTDQELVARLISERLRINVGHIKDSRMDARDWDTFAKGKSKLEELNIAIDDRSGISASDVRGFARAVSREGKLTGVVVDYMQLLVSKNQRDRHLQVAEFSRQLKLLAKDLRVPVIALSQLNRQSETSALAVPKLSDLRESGAIEQDADCVMLLRKDGDAEDDARTNVRLIIDVAKNRHGRTGEVSLLWDGMHSRAIEWNEHEWKETA